MADGKSVRDIARATGLTENAIYWHLKQIYHKLPISSLVEPGGHPRLDPDVVARTLGLTPAESQVAVWLADGKSVRDIARATGLTENAIYWHLKQIYHKLPISSRQVDLVRLVLSIAEFG